MKKYITLIGFFTLMGVTSCSEQKDLILSPFNSVSDTQAYDTETDFANASRGMYARGIAVTGGTLSGLNGGNYYGGTMLSLPDVLTDNVIICQKGRLTYRLQQDFKYTADITWDMWTNAYSTIRRANGILENVAKLPETTPAQIATKNNFKGEALAVRALAHFDMVKLYGKAFPQATDADLGVPYVTNVDPTAKPVRESVKSNYSKIEADLKVAAGLIGGGNGVYRFNKSSVYGLLSRLYLYMGQWQNCVDASSESLKIASDPGSLTSFPSIWKDASNAGVLLKLQLVDRDAVSPGVEYSQSSASGVRSEYVADFELFSLYKATDVRKNAYIGSSVFSGSKYNNIIKYAGRAVGNVNVIDPKVLRVAEVWLNRSEAYAQLGKDTEALADLNALRKNRYSDYTAGTEAGNSLKAEIDVQRRLELAFEGHRFFDLKRKNLPVQRSNKGDLSDGTGKTFITRTLAAGSTFFQLPLPTNEIKVNPNIVQNPGY